MSTHYYTAGSMPLAFMQEDFLMFENFLLGRKDIDFKHIIASLSARLSGYVENN